MLLAALRPHALALGQARVVWVALSGGADSTALLLAVKHSRLASCLRASHINHGLHPSAGDWAKHCAQLCDRLGIELDVHTLSPPASGFTEGLEAWARHGRYAHWQTLVGANEVLLQGHHYDDQVETVALRLHQGRLPLAIPQQRNLNAHPNDALAGRVLRPLLGVSKAQLRRSLTDAGEDWIEDPSNQDTRLLRNAMRALFASLPLAVGTEPAAALQASLVRLGGLSRRLVNALQARLGGGRALSGAGELTRLPLAVLSSGAVVQGLGIACGAVGLGRAKSAGLLASLRQLAERGPAEAQRPVLELSPATAAGVLQLWVVAGDPVDVVVWREPRWSARTLLLPNDGSPLSLDLPHGRLWIAGAPGAPIRVRPGVPGERISRNDRSQAVRELLRASGVPRWARTSYPLIEILPAEDQQAAALVLLPAQLTPDTDFGSVPGPGVRARWVPGRVP